MYYKTSKDSRVFVAFEESAVHRILIVEDEVCIREELSLLLTNEGYEVLAVNNFDTTVTQIRSYVPDLVLLDIGLPNQDGYMICKEIRQFSDVPILFVTSRNTSIDEIKALSLGGDDFIVKPYVIPVLLARIRAVFRRSGVDAEETISFNGLSLDLSRSCIRSGGSIVEVTKNEGRILWCLMKQSGIVVSRANLIEFLWNEQIYIDDNTLSVNISRLRTKLEEIGVTGFIQTKHGLGYKV